MSAQDAMNQINRNALHAEENGKHIFIEDHTDPDGRMYRLEYQCDRDGRNAEAFCLHNPWGGNPFDMSQSHIRNTDGWLCLRSHVAPALDLASAVKRARFWCTGFSYLQEHGYQATCRDIPEWS